MSGTAVWKFEIYHGQLLGKHCCFGGKKSGNNNSPYCTIMLCNTPNFTALNCNELSSHVKDCTFFRFTGPMHGTALFYIILHCSSLFQYCTALSCTALHSTVLHCTALHCTALSCTALRCTFLHFPALHCTALRCTVLHCTALGHTETTPPL